MYVCVYYLLSRVWLFVAPWTVALQASLSMEFSRQEYWSGFPFPSPGILYVYSFNFIHHTLFIYNTVCSIQLYLDLYIFCLLIYCMMFVYSHMPLEYNLPGCRNFVGLEHYHLHLQCPALNRWSAPICVKNVCPPHMSIHAYILQEWSREVERRRPSNLFSMVGPTEIRILLCLFWNPLLKWWK